MQLAAGQAIARDALGMKRAEIVARTDDDGAGRDAAAAGFEPSRLGAVDHGLAQERDAMALGKERCELRNGLARLDADLVRTVERAGKVGGAQAVAMIADLARLEQAALGAHVGGHELLEHGAALRDGALSASRPRCRTAIPAASATSSHTSRERMARRQHSPACWPVTVMKPKFRIEAPLA